MKYVLLSFLGVFASSIPVDMTNVDKIKDISPRIQRQYEEVAHAFTIEGEPIHPLVMYRFITAWSDYGPDLLSVNLTEALRCKEEGESRAILFNLCGHGYFDMQAYTDYNAGKLQGYAYDESEVAMALAGLPSVA